VTLDFVERREQRPSFEHVAIVDIGVSRRTPLPRPSAVSKLTSVPARDLARRGPTRIDPEANRFCSTCLCFQLSQDGVGAVERPDLPRERQHIPPVAISVKKALQQNVVRAVV
jgi:hypothetical protein